MSIAESDSSPGISALEQQVISVFVDGVKVLGLPRSVGEIYGLLFITREPLSLDDLVQRLEISKGSASQGLRTLKSLGAVREATGNGQSERRTYYEAATELKRLAGGFIREQIRPHLDSGKNKVRSLSQAVAKIEDPEQQRFMDERIDRLDKWMRNAGKVLPILQKLLGQ